MVVITFTPAALVRAKKVVADSNRGDATGIRIAVAGGGCSGFQYQMHLESSPAADDHRIEQDGLKIYIDPRSALYLNGVRVDYTETPMGAGFKFDNPNASGTCGCGESFTV